MKSTLSKLVALKIPALRGKDAETNGMILELLALEGAQTVWNINKLLGRSRERYPTIFRAVNRLKERGYVMKTGTVKMAKKKGRTLTYGLTWRGFIASLTSEKVCSNVLNALEKNPQIEFPIPTDLLLTKIKELFTQEEINGMVYKLVEAIGIIPLDLEMANEMEIAWYIIPALDKVGFRLPEKDWSRLEKNPEFLRFVYNLTLQWEDMLRKSLEGIRPLRQKIENLMGQTVNI